MSTGQRIEVLEGQNVAFKEQLNPVTAFIYRRGLAKNDLNKDTLVFRSSNVIALGSKKVVAS